MTISINLPWWALPAFLAVIGIVVPVIDAHFRPSGHWDFVTPFARFAFFLVFEVAALGICIGRWLS